MKFSLFLFYGSFFSPFQIRIQPSKINATLDIGIGYLYPRTFSVDFNSLTTASAHWQQLAKRTRERLKQEDLLTVPTAYFPQSDNGTRT
jgi:hypothetical protein